MTDDDVISCGDVNCLNVEPGLRSRCGTGGTTLTESAGVLKYRSVLSDCSQLI